MKKLILLLCITIFISRCSKHDYNTSDFSKSYIYSFLTVESSFIIAEIYNSDQDSMSIHVQGYEQVLDKVEKERLLEKYNDTKFNCREDVMDPARWVLAGALLTIDIVSDKDFDEAHPAGKSLADISHFSGSTPYPYIKGGYKYLDNRPGLTTRNLNKKLNELTNDDLYLLNYIFSISVKCKDAIKGLHKMKLIITKEDGTKAELPFEIDFK